LAYWFKYFAKRFEIWVYDWIPDLPITATDCHFMGNLPFIKIGQRLFKSYYFGLIKVNCSIVAYSCNTVYSMLTSLVSGCELMVSLAVCDCSGLWMHTQKWTSRKPSFLDDFAIHVHWNTDCWTDANVSLFRQLFCCSEQNICCVFVHAFVNFRCVCMCLSVHY